MDFTPFKMGLGGARCENVLGAEARLRLSLKVLMN